MILLAFSEMSFDFSKTFEKYGLCSLSLPMAKIGATFSYHFFLYWQKIILMSYPYKTLIIMSSYIATDIGNALYKKIDLLCGL